MATFTSIHIKTDKRELALKALQEVSDLNTLTMEKFPAGYLDVLAPDNEGPNLIIIGDVKDGWVQADTNSFNKLHTWLQSISGTLDTQVVQVIGQTVSDIYYFLMYDKGILQREIEVYHGDFDATIDKGEKFSFEKTPLVPVTEEDWQHLFDRDTLEDYCKQLGFNLFSNQGPEQYFILKNVKLNYRSKSAPAQQKSRWKFW